MNSIKVLVVDDEPDILILIKDALTEEDFTVFTARNAATAIKLSSEKNIDMIVLDLELGSVSGWDVCNILKINEQTKNIPIIMITAKHVTTDDIVRGLEVGADDYVTKPFKLNVLIARINAVLRRRGEIAQPKKVLESLHLKLHVDEHKIMLNKKEMVLTPKEFRILSFFLSKQGVVLDRSYLMENIWGYDYYGNTRTIDKHVENLRKKLGRYGKCIETVEGVGYRFTDT
ncbi:MAG: response regulator transcription factor [bacterium]|nr:response regulator transcription factor [bacterium]